MTTFGSLLNQLSQEKVTDWGIQLPNVVISWLLRPPPMLQACLPPSLPPPFLQPILDRHGRLRRRIWLLRGNGEERDLKL